MASRVLEKKLKKVLEMRTDTPALLESLEAISTLFAAGRDHGEFGGGGAEEGAGGRGSRGYAYSTLDARRSLREDLEKQVCGGMSSCDQLQPGATWWKFCTWFLT